MWVIPRRRRVGLLFLLCEGLVDITNIKPLATPAICKTGDGPAGDFLLLGDGVSFLLLGDGFKRLALGA